MYRPFHKLRVRFAEMELKQNEIAKRAGMAPQHPHSPDDGLSAVDERGDHRRFQGAGHPHRLDRHVLL